MSCLKLGNFHLPRINNKQKLNKIIFFKILKVTQFLFIWVLYLKNQIIKTQCTGSEL